MSYGPLFEPPKVADWYDGFADAGDPDGLRYYQRSGCQAILDGFAKGAESQLLVMATGLGKTQVFGAVAKHWPGSVLVLAHRDELVEQARKRLEQMTGETVDIEQGDWKAQHRTRLVVGSVQSFHKRRLDKMPKGRYSLVIADEAHHYLAKSFRRALEHFDAKVLGVTATPDRGDEKALGAVFDSVAYVFDIEDGIDAGYLVPIVGKRVVLEEISLDNVHKTSGDLQAGELDQEMLKAVGGIVQQTIKLEPLRRAICFFPGVRSAEAAMHQFNAVEQDSACFISAETEQFERRRIVKDFHAGRYKRLCNCGIATEGFDSPGVSLIVHGRPTLSRALYAQMTGRGTRVLPGTVDHLDGPAMALERRMAIAGSAKQDLAVLDVVGNSTKHSLSSVEDILGGNYSDEEVYRAKKDRKEGGDPRAALRDARAELERMARAVKASVKASVRPFDPFRVFGLEMPDEEKYTSRFGHKPATDGQIAALRKWKVPDEEIDQLSKSAASKLMAQLIGRKQAGLAGYGQLRVLQGFGIYDRNITKDRASAAITYIASKGWGKSGPVDPAVLADIVSHKRAAGED